MDHFFVTGYNKSGTTFLQMLLDSHPQINCPPEHHVKSITGYLKKFDDTYLPVARLFDERTANQGLRYNSQTVFNGALRGILTALMEAEAPPSTTLCGLNDNLLFQNLPFFSRLFPEASFVYMVRDPREAAVSLWHHLVRTEPHRTEGHTIDSLVPGVAAAWQESVQQVTRFRQADPRGEALWTVRYEDLIGPERAFHVAAMLRFLGVGDGADRVAAMLARNAFDKVRDQASGDGENAFFRSGGRASWREELSAGSVTALEERCRAEMLAMGYAPEYADAGPK